MFSYKPLLTKLVEKNITKTQLREAIGCSPSTLAKITKEEYISLELLDKICTYLNCDIDEVIKHQP